MDEQSTWFDEEYYLKSKLAQLHATEPDAGWTIQSLRDAIANAGLTPFSHFQAYGLQERTSPNPSFNAHEYLEAKLRQLQEDEPGKYNSIDEVADAIRDAGLGLWEHFNQYGWKEGVNPSNDFDINGYFDKKLAELQKNDPEGNWDIDKVKQAFEEAGLDPVSHYAAYGKDEEGVEPVEVPEEDRVPDDPRPPVDPDPEPEPEPEPEPSPGASFTVTEVGGVITFSGSPVADVTVAESESGDSVTFTSNGISQTLDATLSELRFANVSDIGRIVADTGQIILKSLPAEGDSVSPLKIALHSTIQAAIDAADANDEVHVGAGFDQGINLTSDKDLIIIGTDLPENAPSTIDANGSVYALWASGDGFTGTVTIDGLTVVAGSEGGIGQFMTASAGQFHVLNNVITTSESSYQKHGNSIQISGEGSTVIGNTVDVAEYTTANDSWSTSGITVVKDASSAIIANNTVTGPAKISDGNSIVGIAADGKHSGDAGLMEIQITGNTLTQITSGISLSDKVEAEVTGNTLSNNAVGISLGTTFSGWLDELNITIDGNTFSGNGKAISINDFDGSGQITIQGNFFTSIADMEGAIWLNNEGVYTSESDITIDLEQFSTAVGELADNVIYTSTKESGAIYEYITFGALTDDQVTVTWTDGVFKNLELKLTGAADFDLSEIQDFFGGIPVS